MGTHIQLDDHVVRQHGHVVPESARGDRQATERRPLDVREQGKRPYNYATARKDRIIYQIRYFCAVVYCKRALMVKGGFQAYDQFSELYFPTIVQRPKSTNSLPGRNKPARWRRTPLSMYSSPQFIHRTSAFIDVSPAPRSNHSCRECSSSYRDSFWSPSRECSVYIPDTREPNNNNNDYDASTLVGGGVAFTPNRMQEPIYYECKVENRFPPIWEESFGEI